MSKQKSTNSERHVRRYDPQAARRSRIARRAEVAVRIGCATVGLAYGGGDGIDRHTQRRARRAVEAVLGRPVLGLYLLLDD